jgi:hypothetical protein
MQKDAGEILRDALSLPAEARAALAGSLLESLDTEVDENAEELWRAEIRKRMADMDSGSVRKIP